MIAGPRQSMYGTAGGEATAGTLSFCRGEFMSTINERIAREVMGWSPTFAIRKGDYFYRPGAHGYTTCLCDAGRYTKEEAERHLCRGEIMDIVPFPMPQPDTNPADAMAVLKVCAEKTDQVSITQCEGDWAVCEGDGNGDSYPEGEGKTLEAAICNFALKLFSPRSPGVQP